MRRAPRSHEGLTGVLDGEFQVVNPTTLELLEEQELVLDISEGLGVFVETFLVLNGKTGQLRLPLEVFRNTLPDEIIGNETNQHGDGDRDQTNHNSSHPLAPKLRGLFVRDTERNSTNEDNKNLSTAHSEVDSKEEPVARQALEDVEAVVKTTVASI